MKILWISDTPFLNTFIARQSLIICKHLADRGHQIFYLGWNFFQNPQNYEKIILFPAINESGQIYGYGGPIGLKQIILKKFYPDVVISMGDIIFVEYIITKLYKEKFFDFKKKWFHWYPFVEVPDSKIRKNLISKVENIIVISHYSKRLIHPIKESGVIYPAIDTDVFNTLLFKDNLRDHSRRFLYNQNKHPIINLSVLRGKMKEISKKEPLFILTNYCRNKSHDESNQVLKVFRIFSKNRNDTILSYIINPQEKLKDLFSIASNQKIIPLNDQIEDNVINGILNIADVNISLSNKDEFDISMLESLAAATVVLVPNYPYVSEFVRFTDLRIKCNDDKILDEKDLLIKIENLYKHKELKENFSLKLQKFVKRNCDVKEVVKRLESLINKRYIINRKKIKKISYKPVSQQKKIKINIKGCIFIPDSLTMVIKYLSLALHKLKCEVSIQPLLDPSYDAAISRKFDSLGVQTQEQNLIKRMINKKINERDFVHVYYVPSGILNNYFDISNFGKNIYYNTLDVEHLNYQMGELINKKFDAVWAVSNHSKVGFIKSGILEEKISIIPHGANIDVFNPQVTPIFLPTNKKFRFLSLCYPWFIRKGIDILIKAYIEEFTYSEDVCLVLKFPDIFYHSRKQFFALLNKLTKNRKKIPQIVPIFKNSSLKELASYYTACNCYVSPFKGEGFGMCILEAMACGLPCIITNWGGPTDFCDNENSYLLRYKLVEKNFFSELEGSHGIGKWAEPDMEHLKKLMRYVYENEEKAKKIGLKAHIDVKSSWTWENAALKAIEAIKKIK